METPHTVRTIAVADVRVPPSRLRALGDLEALRESIASNGLLQPIVVDRALTLVCGLHRLEACRLLGYTEILAVVEDLDPAQARLAEVDENLCRRELTALERAEHIALRRTLWTEMHAAQAQDALPDMGDGKKRAKGSKSARAADAASEAPLAAFVDDTARRTGRAKAAVREELRIGELPEDVRAVARQTDVRDNKRELLALTRMPEEEQRRAVAAVKSGEAKSVRKKAAKPAAPTAANSTAGGEECPFDLAPGDGPEGSGEQAGIHAGGATTSSWGPSHGALEREVTRANIVRLVGEAERTLAKVMSLWPSGDDGDEGQQRLLEAVDAVTRLSRWMEAPASNAAWSEPLSESA